VRRLGALNVRSGSFANLRPTQTIAVGPTGSNRPKSDIGLFHYWGQTMNTQLFLFGTSHPLQCGVGYGNGEIDNFRKYIRKVCATEKIALVAEEMSQQGLSHHQTESTVAESLARELNIQHRYVDLEENERARFQISDGTLTTIAINLSHTEPKGLREDLNLRISYPIRERYWVARILSANLWPTLFICGAAHVINVASIIGGIVDRAVIVEYDFVP